MAQPDALTALRRAVSALAPAPDADALFRFGLPGLDAWLGGGLARARLHEIHAAAWADATPALGFALGLALRAAGQGPEEQGSRREPGQGSAPGRPVVWIRQDFAALETGQPYGAGVAAFGLDPGTVLVVRARDPAGVLRAAAEAARCPAVGATLVEIWGEPRALDLTASRRLALAAHASGVTLVMLRLQAAPAPSAAASRWRVAAHASRALEANAPGSPAFAATLLRHRAGLGPRTWHLEWDRDEARFRDPPLPRAVVPVPAREPAAARVAGLVPPAILPLRRAG